jgi:hypothetical protein
MRRLALAMAIVALVWPAASLAGENDQRVADALARNLKASEVLKGFQIQVKYREGTARLEGWVRNKQQADEALAIANRTPDVERVISQLEIREGGGSLVVPASTIKPQRLPPAPDVAASSAAGPALDQPVLRSALRTPRNNAGQPAEFRPAPAANQVPMTELQVGQRHPSAQPVASASPRPLPAASGSRVDRPAPMPPPPGTIIPKPIVPKPMPMPAVTAPSNTQRSKPTTTTSKPAADSGWGRGSVATPQAQNATRRPQAAAMPMMYPQPVYPQVYAQGYPMQMAAYPQPVPMGAAPMGAVPMNGGMPSPVPAHVPGMGGGVAPAMYDQPYLPNYAWPTYAAYPNYAALTYPKQYSPTAWPYIGPFYPYPQVPLGWRKVTLEWDDGWWFLDFSADRRHCCGR